MMKLADIPGMSVVLISNGKLVWRKNFGVANAETGQAVTDSTIFEAASLTKIVTAYAALQLVLILPSINFLEIIMIAAMTDALTS